jgi:hypothetical protein
MVYFIPCSNIVMQAISGGKRELNKELGQRTCKKKEPPKTAEWKSDRGHAQNASQKNMWSLFSHQFARIFRLLLQKGGKRNVRQNKQLASMANTDL